ncbi:hypothetical protein ACFQL4_05910 [Halosimplex aquaticum]
MLPEHGRDILDGIVLRGDAPHRSPGRPLRARDRAARQPLVGGRERRRRRRAEARLDRFEVVRPDGVVRPVVDADDSAGVELPARVQLRVGRGLAATRERLTVGPTNGRSASS